MIEGGAEVQHMNSKFIRFFGIAGMMVISAIPLVVFASTPPVTPNMDKWVGTWILNIQKSRYGDEKPPSDPAVFKQILKIRVSEGTMDVYFRTELMDGTDAADETHLLDLTGKPHVTEFGGFKPVTETFRQIDGNTFEITLKARPTESEVAPGELTIRVKLTMSADGNTIREAKEYHYKEFAETNKTARSDDPNPAEGSVLVFDRERPNR
jgi:hypothetical protein